jgi:hypothetical protein
MNCVKSKRLQIAEHAARMRRQGIHTGFEGEASWEKPTCKIKKKMGR